MVVALVWIVGGLVVLGVLIALSHRMLVTSRGGGTGGTDAFGAVVDVFEPARARADRDLESHHTLRQEDRTPDDDGDLTNAIVDGRSIRIRRPS